MVDNRFNKLLTVILIVILITIFGILGFWGYDLIKKNSVNAGADQAIDQFDNLIAELKSEDGENNEENQENNEEEGGNASSSSSSTGRRAISYKYKGFNVVGKIEIPKTKAKYPVLDVATISSMEASVGIIYGPGLNLIGNTVIMGHNYRNGTFFSNNKKLKNGDSVYITDTYGDTVEYIIYHTYVTSSTDFDYATRDTAGKREITLASCTDDSNSRLIIWAKEK